MDKLAINGGQPIRNAMLPYGQQWIDGDDISAVIATLESSFITQGPAIQKFEQAIADYVGAQYAVAFCNGTAALHGACFAAGISTGDEVITTPLTFLASSNAVLYQGGVPIFADIDENTYNISPNEVEKKITNKTKAIIAVDFTGQPVEIDRITSLARKHNLVVIQDAAHSLGAEYKGVKVGSTADMTMFSFHPVKHITTGEGGIITTDSKAYYDRLVLFRSHGMTKDDGIMTKNDGPWYYEMHELGYNYRMTDLQASLGVSQMSKLHDFIEKRRTIAMQYNEAFSGMEGIITPFQHADTNSSWHLYVLKFKLDRCSVGRRELFDALRAENIGVHVHYIPVYLQPYYQNLGYPSGLCPNAENYYDNAITLPLFPKMTDQDVRDVILAVKKVYAAYYF
ncbi:UDP-4-amino-4,6-dideoxy-N-acetyl-beta-L-altrosamine transaminase [Paenibacillus whitsoniae]|uniref:UDP-4-amino-4, 6-dideoxy-N-acetyl-beta-L-altrosamine transaminase n=1 Tax=Paenibacillus whitsoniae TaxID=2496558 RepID=A0A430JA62_9BACL|nr:UDP-4-amino-4,6-dideoxy-N-acetyl-beta-L-altrosamine transaminase [Paenibacillus whitsoniae]RTE07939.1 UDP-4-amino-4,6-dideoxy-N-acetyl-beta-L-altrosamine transaminase [Paenibacillus whitsoniae]